MDAGEGGSGGKGTALTAGNGADFVKKLYRMLSEEKHQAVVRWSETGQSFIVYDNNDFTKNVLPQHFKHSNFASFVRQLNKYDFHKVRANEDSVPPGPNGDQAWEFHHPQFRRGNDNNLEGIKRKAPSQRQKKESEEPQVSAEAQAVIMQLQNRLEDVVLRAEDLSRKYHSSIHEIYSLNARMSRLEEILGRFMRTGQVPQDTGPDGGYQQQQQSHGHPNGYGEMNGNGMAADAFTLSGFGNTASQSGIALDATDPQVSTTFRQEMRRPQGLRKKSTGFVAPRWRQTPKVLLVEDDATCRKIGLKFLEATGCKGYFACDGFEAVRKIQDAGDHGYDMILMDIIMPHLDGVSTCHIIRTTRPDRQDPPIIAMTSNIRSTDINVYFNAGMIDVLPKPFTRDGLLQMLQKYLNRLRDDPSDSAVPHSGRPTNGSSLPPLPPYSVASAAASKLDSKATTSPVLKIEYDAAPTSHPDDDDDHTTNGAHDTPDSSLEVVPPSSSIIAVAGHHAHHHNGGASGADAPAGDYTDMLNASAGIYTGSLGGLGPGPAQGVGPSVGASPRGAMRRPMEAAVPDEYSDSRMKRMRFSGAT
ncbi:hypothetical protein DRE_02870 [Drechslerella stenobrocha 248]|uniref:Response regulatory domain-containing protein n=1 Tax=Drechslerella stenobrocha 248 TaxID=1043628 RepID=W7I6V8_9PEZI|nr:hypothetical protein DRE_02870 [Drechslerella stenobrocha 248]